MNKVKFIDLFAGIGGIRKGFEIAFKKCGYETECVMTSEIKPHAYKVLLANNPNEVISTQMINRHLKTIKAKYGVKVEHLSSHSFRKTFGRKVVESAGEQSEMALIKLSEIFNYASPMITRRYLGLRAEELEEVYNV